MPVRVLCAGPPSESAGFHKTAMFGRTRCLPSRFYVGVISLLKGAVPLDRLTATRWCD